ncbi:unnamed protein product [Larinioides sclopetarius]|uniref:Uncharacterized protein n=1 Tax=Larinioides sclopetarius TaxID=280406 RepID=A0AAV2B4H0_9ARAC
MKAFVLLVFIPSFITADILCPKSKTTCPEESFCVIGFYSKLYYSRHFMSKKQNNLSRRELEEILQILQYCFYREKRLHLARNVVKLTASILAVILMLT